MKVDLLIFQLAIIFLPGIMWAGFDSNYASKIRPSDSQFFLRAFLFGITTYVVEYLLFSAFGPGRPWFSERVASVVPGLIMPQEQESPRVRARHPGVPAPAIVLNRTGDRHQDGRTVPETEQKQIVIAK